ncbi:polyhydroxyalkanoic acid system family protein [Caulobacter henricii]|uniref:Polyhydroxyalkanoic acid system protein n=1 Tax=Caulobacter henricii TaxID=69395 RepID=A0A0P0P410_9CAUL|nr:polyhydroxyalkanoic acid system family protein [Caulobacter henricii]ALL15358.1 polyhydroxyalkanoic acid system protein [Caulobacter henricii]
MSKPITITIPHKLGAAEARRRIESGFAQLASQIPGGSADQVQQTWNGDTLTFSAVAMGQTISGTLDVLGDLVKLDIVLPGMLGMIAGKIRDQLQKRGQLLLENK